MEKEASFYIIEKQQVRCNLCPQNCFIKDGQVGICGVRKNIGGKLITQNYQIVSGLGFDPIEKKPLYHFYPGKIIYSVGSFGCNLKCSFCQNCDISQAIIQNYHVQNKKNKEFLVKQALKNQNNIGIAFTYNEPTVFYEFMYDTAELAKNSGLKTAMVSNGYINHLPLQKLLPYIDAFNIDLKAFTNDFYKKITESSLNPVLKTLQTIKKADKHLEITNLVIPSLNDDEKVFREMINWIKNNLGKDTVLHLSRYFPRYQLNIEPTPEDMLINLYNIANAELYFVYLGNVTLQQGRNTYCHHCGNLLIVREGYFTQTPGLTEKGKCKNCETLVIKNI